MKLNILKTLISVGPSIKKWIWADGNFKLDRALILLAGLAILGLGYYFLGPTGMEVVLGYLEELSDIIGYVE